MQCIHFKDMRWKVTSAKDGAPGRGIVRPPWSSTRAFLRLEGPGFSHADVTVSSIGLFSKSFEG